MSLSLFNAISPRGSAVEVLTDATGAPRFKRADLGRFLGIVDMRHTFEKIATKSRLELSEPGACGAPTLLQGQNDHDAFVDLEGALGVRGCSSKKVRLCKI